jgi:hypothetical protein
MANETTGEWDEKSAKRISSVVQTVERMQAELQQLQGKNAGSKSKPNNAAMIVGARNEYGMYPAQYVRLKDHTKTDVRERWERLSTEKEIDCYVIIGHVEVTLNDIFDVTLCAVITETETEIPVFLFTESNYGYYLGSSGALTSVSWQNDTDPRCEANGTISVSRKYIVLMGRDLTLMEYSTNPASTGGGWYIIGEDIVYVEGAPPEIYNSGPYDSYESASSYA